MIILIYVYMQYVTLLYPIDSKVTSWYVRVECQPHNHHHNPEEILQPSCPGSPTPHQRKSINNE